MAETVIFAEQTLEFSDDSSGLYIAQNKEPFVLESGKTYRVIWDGQEFTLNSFNFKMEGFDGIGIGNEAFFTGVSTELTEPFSVYYLTSSGYSAIVTTDNSASHTVAIYLVEESLSVVVKDRTGADVEYSGVAGIRVRTTDGDTKDFLDSSAFPSLVETTIQLDFSDGNMIVVPGVDELFSKVTVVKPATLIPENVAKGVDIAGIVGTLRGAAIKTGTFKGTGDYQTIKHGLGVVPDFIYIHRLDGGGTGGPFTEIATGISSKIVKTIGETYHSQWILRQQFYSDGQAYNPRESMYTIPERCIDVATYGFIYNVTDDVFEYGITLSGAVAYPLRPDATYIFVVAGGLT